MPLQTANTSLPANSDPISWANRTIFKWASKVIHWFCFTLLCDWFRKLTPLSQPIKCENNTNHDLFSRAFSALLVFILSSRWHFRPFSLLLVERCNNFDLIFYNTQLKRPVVEKPVYHATEKVSESFLEILVPENEGIHTDLVSRRSSSKYPPSRSSFKSSTSPVAIAWSTESITLYRGDARCVTIMKKIRLQQTHRTFSKATGCPCGFKSPPHWGVLAENCQLNGVAEDGCICTPF